MKSHKFDAVSFISGLVVTVIGLLFLIPNTTSDLIDFVTGIGIWFWPILFLAVGLAVIIPVLVPKRTDELDTES